jgi:hypothetical protein
MQLGAGVGGVCSLEFWVNEGSVEEEGESWRGFWVRLMVIDQT